MRSEKEKLRFSKMAGCGNDYIYFNCFDQKIHNPEGLAVRLSDRNYGIGGEGVVIISPSEVADAKMRIFNRDGSEGKMGGNAIRCVGKYLYDHGMVSDKTITIETLSGIKSIELYVHRKEVTHAKVNMGKADLEPKAVPVKLNGDKIVNYPVEIGGKEYNITCVGMGNPHCVVFVENVETLPLQKIGPAFEECGIFPEGINVEFVQVLNPSTIKMRVWERGIGETWSCGTGACAAAVAAVENGFCGKGKDITVKLKGGDLTVKYTDETVFMTGNAELIFDGEIII